MIREKHLSRRIGLTSIFLYELKYLHNYHRIGLQLKDSLLVGDLPIQLTFTQLAHQTVIPLIVSV